MEQHRINQKYRGYVQPNNQDVFAILHDRLQHIDPQWYTRPMLDFGCNVGHLLGTSNGLIPPEQFYGVDIHKGSLFVAKQKYPKANWIHYNGYNATFNPTGKLDAMFELPVKPEIIIAYGVFTHCDLQQVRKWFKVFTEIISPGGIIAVSFWEDIGFQNYQRFLLRGTFGLKTNFPTPQYERSLYLVNRNEIVVDKDELGYESADWVEAFYKQSFLEKEFPGLKRTEGLHTYHPVYTYESARS